MKRFFLILVLLFGFLFILGQVGEVVFARESSPGKEQAEKESGFWQLFYRIFSKPEPKWKGSAPGLTEVTGVRGVEREGKLKKVYDFATVQWMERYQIDEQKLREFLKSRRLGPYQGGKK